MAQILILGEHREKLLANAAASAASEDGSTDAAPVIKLFTPDAGATWLISEMAEDGDTLFGLCDLGMGEPEMGYVSLSEISSVRGRLGLPVERDVSFVGKWPLSAYAKAATRAGRIVEDLL